MGLVQTRPQVTFLNVNMGKLRNKKKGIEAPGYEGIITGIQLIKKKDLDGRDREELQIRMADPTDTANPNVIISGLFESVNGVTVWARMLIARLLKATREGTIGQGTLIQLGAYTPKIDSKATCISLRVDGDATPIRGIELPVHDQLQTRGIIRDGVVELAAIYGDLSKNPPMQSQHEDNGGHGEAGDDGHEEDYLEEYEPIPGDHRASLSTTPTQKHEASPSMGVRTATPATTSTHNGANGDSTDVLYAEFERCAKKKFGETWEMDVDDLMIEMFNSQVLFASSMTQEQLVNALGKLRVDLKLPSLSDAEMIWKTAQQRKWTRAAFEMLLAHYELKSEYEIPTIALSQFLGDVRNVEYMQEFLKATASTP